LTLDGQGHLYGATNTGGVGGEGIVFELSNPIPSSVPEPSALWLMIAGLSAPVLGRLHARRVGARR
jgi:hypothetical protein